MQETKELKNREIGI